MFVSFELDEAQWVFIKYHIRTYTENQTYIDYNLLIDGVSDTLFFTASNDLRVHMNTAQNEVYLSKGNHTVQLTYTTGVQYQVRQDWRLPAILIIKYKSKTP